MKPAKNIATKLARAHIEAIVLICLAIFLSFASIHFDAFEEIMAFIAKYEEYEIDEILTLVIFMSIGFAIFAFRRFNDLKDEVEVSEKMQQQLLHASMHDALTTLPNRRHFDQDLTTKFGHYKTQPHLLAIVIIDLNRFKFINDCYGHQYGDEVLKTVAKRLLKTLSNAHLAYRLGGDEFAIIIDDHANNERHLYRICHQISFEIEKPMLIQGIEIVCGSSIGVSIANEHCANIDDLMQQADNAMYYTKSNQLSHVSFYDSQMDEQRVFNRQIEVSLKQAITEQQLSLRYQPQFNRSNQIVSLEATVFWNHPALGVLPANKFLNVAESNGQINLIDYWCLEQACKDAQYWPDNTTLSLNISPHTFQRLNFIGELDSIIALTSFDNSRLTIQISEQLLIQKVKSKENSLSLLKQRGIHTVLNDFGTGYSSLLYLQKFDIETIKINREVINNITDKQQQAKMVKAIIDLANSLKISIIISGIENQEQFQDWLNIGCEFFQGDFLSNSLSQAEILAIDDMNNLSAINSDIKNAGH